MTGRGNVYGRRLAGRAASRFRFVSVLVRRFGRLLHQLRGLHQQAFGALGIALHVPIVGLLRLPEFGPGQLALLLGVGQVRMPRRGNVHRRFLREGGGAHQAGYAKNESESEIIEVLHGVVVVSLPVGISGLVCCSAFPGRPLRPPFPTWSQPPSKPRAVES